MSRPGNPWLLVPLGDYEGHMRAPGVDQLDSLAELFALAVKTCAPRTIAILGVAGGNGLDAIAADAVQRVVAIDINPAYLAETARRYAHLQLELHCIDLAAASVARRRTGRPGARRTDLRARGDRKVCGQRRATVATRRLPVRRLAVASESTADVSPSRFESIQHLRDDFSLVDRTVFIRRASDRGMRLVSESTRTTGEGKSLWLGMFQHVND